MTRQSIYKNYDLSASFLPLIQDENTTIRRNKRCFGALIEPICSIFTWQWVEPMLYGNKNRLKVGVSDSNNIACKSEDI